MNIIDKYIIYAINYKMKVSLKIKIIQKKKTIL